MVHSYVCEHASKHAYDILYGFPQVCCHPSAPMVKRWACTSQTHSLDGTNLRAVSPAWARAVSTVVSKVLAKNFKFEARMASVTEDETVDGG